jgi:ABC-2 type transport system permease protein
VTAFAIAAARARRIVRDRIALFFLVVLPILVIVIIGAIVGSVGKFRVGVVVEDDGPLAASLVRDLDRAHALDLHRYASVSSGKTALRRSEIATLVEIPTDTEVRLRRGGEVQVIAYGERADSDQRAAVAAVSSMIAAHGARVQAALFAEKQAGGSFDAHLSSAGQLVSRASSVQVVTQSVDSRSRFLPQGYSSSAPTMLVLFVFINALAGGAAMIWTRQLGMYDRMLAAPVTPRQIVFGETVVYFLIALVQSLLILSVGALVFGVHWGDPLAAMMLVVTWALVGTGAGMLAGTLFKTPEQSTSIAPTIGIVLGMLGGCMWPLAIVGSTMRAVGHLAPHAWAVDAWTELLSGDSGLFDIARELLVLGTFATALLALAVVRLRRSLSV